MIDTGLVLLPLSLAALVFVVFVLPQRLNRGKHQAYYQAEWLKIEALLNSAEGRKLAIIEADKLLDRALRERGYKGDSTGERLKSAGRRLGSINRLWAAHKLRNQLVHETGLSLSEGQARQALQSFHRGLRELGTL
jgi:hypothetical protein